jgi:PmbA protein
MDFQAFQQAVIAAAQNIGLTDYELYFRFADGVSVDVYGKDEVKEFSSATEGGVCFRCIADGKMGYASTQLMTEEGAEDIVRRAVDNARTLEKTDAVFLGEGGQSYPECPVCGETMPDSASLIHKAMEVQQALYAAHPSVVDGTESETAATHSTIRIWNSHGLDLDYDRTVTTVVAAPVVEEKGEKDNDYGIAVGKLAQLDVADFACKTVEKTRAKLGAGVPDTGAWPVVFSPDAMSDLLATFSTAFSAETAQKGLSALRDQEGGAIAAPIVTLVDDPLSEMSAMPIPFDAEGTPARRKNVVENGVLTTLLYDRKTAAAAGKTTTGNASKASYTAPVSVQPFTLYLAAGDCTEAELLKKAERGIYVSSISGLHAGANKISGDFSLQSSGFLIENGEKAAPVKAFTVAGNFFELLKHIVAVADNLEVPSPGGITCYGAPSVLAEGLTVAGK